MSLLQYHTPFLHEVLSKDSLYFTNSVRQLSSYFEPQNMPTYAVLNISF